jgi:hypothetical protein
MSQYLLLLYAPDGDESEAARRWAELPRWKEVTDALRADGLLVSNNALKPVDVATTVRVRGGERELVDGPFAVTKEILAGYYLLDCPNLDVALDAAARLPMAEYGSVEVRPVATADDVPIDECRPATGDGDT